MRTNKSQKQDLETRLGVRLSEYCEIMNPPEYRRKDYQNGQTISEVARSVSKTTDYIFNEIRLKRLKPKVSGGKVRISDKDFLDWLAR